MTESPTRIGPYRILDLLGEGGMAEVYLAEQSEPVKRRVALKILKAGMDSKQIVARFESERQALAVLDHPNIAKIFDGGLAENGRPYFAMEHVKGVPITGYCDDQRLSNEERLQLFIDVCAAVQHAHLKGLIHRDLKPSNILVGTVDGRPQPKIIDFGIAKATTITLTEATLYTKVGQVIGTPQYMSPEQAGVTGLDVDTRSDIYSLGVILYELLVGTAPLDLVGIGEQAVQVALKEKDPPKPSLRFTQLSDTRDEIAKVRRTDAEDLKRALMGDLDWVVMKAIEKNRNRRYETANALAMECRRYLKHEPVLARPPSAGYLLGRFVRRNRLAVVAGSVALLAVIAGAGAATLGYIRATEAQQVALQEAETARQVSDFLVELFEVSDPSEARGNSITAREVLDRGAGSIEAELADQPEIQMTLKQTLGRVYHSLGLYGKADALLAQALDSRRNHGSDQADLVETLQARANLLVDRGNYDEADAHLEEALDIVEAIGGKGEMLASLLTSRAFLDRSRGQYQAAEDGLAQALAVLETSDTSNREEIAASMTQLAIIYRRTGEFDKAEDTFLKALAIQEETLGSDHPAVASTLNSLSIVYVRTKEWDNAEKAQRRALEIRETVLGELHPEFAKSLNNIAGIFIAQGRPEEAVPYLERTLEIREQSLGPDHPSIAETMHNIAVLFRDSSKPKEALSWEEKALRLKMRVLGPDHPDTTLSEHSYAQILGDLGRHEEAEQVFLEVIKKERRVLGADNPQAKETIKSYASLLRKIGREQEADALAADATN